MGGPEELEGWDGEAFVAETLLVEGKVELVPGVRGSAFPFSFSFLFRGWYLSPPFA